MSEEEFVSKKLSVDGISPDLFLAFKLAILQRSMTIKSVIVSFMKDFVESAEAEAKRAKGKGSRG